jgi:hypothetical protein
MLAGALPVPAAADEPPFQVDLEVVAAALFGAQMQIRFGGADEGIKRLLLSAEFLEWRRLNPTASESEATGHLEAMNDGLTDALRPQDRVRGEAEIAMRGASALVALPGRAAPTAVHQRRMVEFVHSKSIGVFDTREDVVSGSLRTAAWISARAAIESEVWSAVRRQSLADRDLAAAWANVVGYPLDPTASLAALKSDPQIEALIDVDAILVQTSRPAFLLEIQRQFGQVAIVLEHESEHARARLAANAAACPVTAQSTCTPEQQQAAKDAAKAEQKDADVGAAAAKILGALARIGDQKTGEKIEKAASAWFSIITAINKYSVAVGGMSAADAIESAAAFVMTGDILGAIVTLVGLFGESTPSLDQQILDQVKEMRKEIRALHQDMQQSFQRVETQLNTIFAVMINEFDRLNATLVGNTAALSNIQNQLAQQDLRLETVAATILTAIGDVELHDTRADVNQYIGYRETYGQPIPTFGEYTDPENEFNLAATDVANHEAFVVDPSLAFDPTVDPTAVLDASGESSALSYLARRAQARDPRISSPIQPFANPSIWNFAAQAYGLLALQNPDFARQVSVVRSQEVRFEGQRILDVASSFSRPTTQTAGDRVNPVFTSLVGEYRTALGRVGARLSAIRTQTVLPRQEPIDPLGTSFVRVPKTYSLFGAANQAVPDSTLPADAATLRPCSTPIGPSLSRPSNVSLKALPAEVRFAHYAYSPSMLDTPRLPEVGLCYDAAFVGVRERFTTSAYEQYGKLRLTMRARFRWSRTNDTLPDAQWQSVRTATYTWPEMLIERDCLSIHCTNPVHVEVNDALNARYPRDRALFEQSAVLATDAALTAVVRSQMAAFLVGRQKKLYELAAAEVHDANTELNGAGRVMSRVARELQAYTRFGFPVALATDDILSSLLFGQYALLVNKTTDPQLEASFTVAANRYACTPAVSAGEPCFGGPFYPLGGQLFVETVGGVAVTQPVTCKVSSSGIPGAPGDPVGDCLVASGTVRLNALQNRYREHTALLVSGEYVEQLPWIADTMEMLPLVDTLVRAGE